MLKMFNANLHLEDIFCALAQLNLVWSTTVVYSLSLVLLVYFCGIKVSQWPTMYPVVARVVCLFRLESECHYASLNTSTCS